MEKKKATPQIKRSLIISTAYSVFAKLGYHGTKIAHIATELGMGHGTFYRYFENKLDIFSHVVDEVIRSIFTVLTEEPFEAANTLDEYKEQAIRIGNRLLKMFVADQRMAKLLFVEMPGIDEGITQKVKAAMEQINQLTENYIKNGQQKGFLRPDLNRRIVARGINSMIFEGVRCILASENPEEEAKEWQQTLTTFLIDGLGK